MATKVNVRSPFFVKFSQSNMVRVEVKIYVYSGTQNTDKGTEIIEIKQKPLPGDEFVILELSEIIRPHLNVENGTYQEFLDQPLNNNRTYFKWVQLESTIT